jgi:hypothetical protein
LGRAPSDGEVLQRCRVRQVPQLVAYVALREEGERAVVGHHLVRGVRAVLLGGLDERGERMGRHARVHPTQEVTDLLHGHGAAEDGRHGGQRGVLWSHRRRFDVLVQLSQFRRRLTHDAGDALVDTPRPGGNEDEGLSGLGEAFHDMVHVLFQLQIVAEAAVFSGQGDGFHRGAESGPHRRLRYRVSVGEQEQRQVRGPFAPARSVGEGQDQVEALGRRGGSAAPAAAEAAAGDVARQQSGAPPVGELFPRDGEAATRRVIDELLVGHAGTVAERHAAKLAAPASATDRF